jgi:diadenosine tetraphosphatase ApaH/serine/threonine PP2A family protein phosphatase
MRSFLPDPGDDEEELLAGTDERRLVFGHTHLAFVRRAATGAELFNPGSVGLPFDRDPRAAYGLLRDSGALEHRRVTYDHGASAAALRARYGSEWADSVAGRIERAGT